MIIAGLLVFKEEAACSPGSLIRSNFLFYGLSCCVRMYIHIVYSSIFHIFIPMGEAEALGICNHCINGLIICFCAFLALGMQFMVSA